MPTVSPQQWNNQDVITSSKLNTPINQIAAVVNGGLDDANISSLSGSKLNATTVPVSAMTVDSNPETRLKETMGDFVASGCVWSISSGLVGTMTAGVVYIGGKRIVVSAIASQTFVASKDTYVSVDNTGTVSIASAVANGAASPALPANSVWLAVVVSGASAITSINLTGLTSTGLLICPRGLSKQTDANGWTVYDRGTLREYEKIISQTGLSDVVGNGQSRSISTALPIGVTDLSNLYFSVFSSTNGVGFVSYGDSAPGSTTMVAYVINFTGANQTRTYQHSNFKLKTK